MSTSGLAHMGLGWPVEGPQGDDGPSSGLGWPRRGQEAGRVAGPETCSRGRVVDLAIDPGVRPAAEQVGGAGLEADDALSVVQLQGTGRGGQEGDLRQTADASMATASTVTEPAGRGQAQMPQPTRAEETRAVEGDGVPAAVAVSRETAEQGDVVNVSEHDQLAASLPDPDSETPLARAVAEDARRRISFSGKVFPRPDHTRILTVANQKGGVGKTTTTVNVAAALAQAGLRVMVIDIDPQGNASTALGIDHHADVPSVYDVLVDGKPIVDVVQECADIPNLWCVPATIDLAGAEIELVSLVARETRMERALTAYVAGAGERGEERLDYVLIDCPPSLGLLTINAFVAADEVFIPIQCEYYALEGLSQLLKNIELIKSHLNPGLHVSTILLTMYDGRTRLSAQVAEEVRSHFPVQVLRTSVPRSVRISEAPSFGQTVMTYDPTSSGALSYLEAASELADRGVAG